MGSLRYDEADSSEAMAHRGGRKRRKHPGRDHIGVLDGIFKEIERWSGPLSFSVPGTELQDRDGPVERNINFVQRL